jgi:hypothetical protein
MGRLPNARSKFSSTVIPSDRKPISHPCLRNFASCTALQALAMRRRPLCWFRPAFRLKPLIASSNLPFCSDVWVPSTVAARTEVWKFVVVKFREHWSTIDQDDRLTYVFIEAVGMIVAQRLFT